MELVYERLCVVKNCFRVLVVRDVRASVFTRSMTNAWCGAMVMMGLGLCVCVGGE